MRKIILKEATSVEIKGSEEIPTHHLVTSSDEKLKVLVLRGDDIDATLIARLKARFTQLYPGQNIAVIGMDHDMDFELYEED